MSHRIATGAPILSVVLNWNGAKTLYDTVSNLVAQTAKPHRILIIDNGSTDGSIDTLQQDFAGVDLLRLPENVGFARGNNAVLTWSGWREADWKNGWIFLSNNDVFYPPDMLEQLRRIGETKDDAVSVSSWIAYADPKDKLWFGGGTLRPGIGYFGHHRLGQQYAGSEDAGIETSDYNTACSVLIPAKYFIEVGGFDPGFPHYGEDGDLSLRLKKRYQGECYVLRKTLAFHRVSSSIGGSAIKYQWRTAAHVRLIRIHYHSRIFGLLGNLIFNVISATRRTGISGALAAWHGWRDGLHSDDRSITWERPQ